MLLLMTLPCCMFSLGSCHFMRCQKSLVGRIWDCLFSRTVVPSSLAPCEHFIHFKSCHMKHFGKQFKLFNDSLWHLLMIDRDNKNLFFSLRLSRSAAQADLHVLAVPAGGSFLTVTSIILWWRMIKSLSLAMYIQVDYWSSLACNPGFPVVTASPVAINTSPACNPGLPVVRLPTRLA